ncbi:DUF6297 family protein [Streptomyces violascens]|uniref:DUF6297 family protein n=1 Tax=Streptomyces violascens TaxID=67381 RepID=UPI0037B45AB1
MTDRNPVLREATEEALEQLHVARGAHRRRKRQDTAFHLYVVALFSAMYLVPFIAIAYGAAGHPLEPYASYLRNALPFAGPAVALAWLRLAVGDALWRGPVLLDAATATWLLPTPVDRGRLLRPRFRRAVVLHSTVGTLAAAGAGYFLDLVMLGRPTAGIAFAAVAGAAFGAFTVAVAGLIVSRDAVAPARRFAGPLTALAATALFCAAVGGPGWARPLFLWTGPWGWLAQCLAADSGRAVALALLLASATAALVRADREVASTPVAVLRRRIRSASSVSAALITVDFRQARLAVRGSPARRSRLPLPRRPWLVIPWRTALGWLSRPALLGWAAGWLTVAYTAVTLARAADGPGRIVGLLVALAAGYAATAGLLEAARLDGDDVGRSRALPWPFPGIVLRHAILPLAVLLVSGAVACALAAALGRPVLPSLLLCCCFPALAGAALISACRGSLPYELLIGAETAMGNTAIPQVAVWYLRGPLAACLVLYPFLAFGLRATGPWAACALAFGLLLGTAALTTWAGVRAWSHIRA